MRIEIKRNKRKKIPNSKFQKTRNKKKEKRPKKRCEI